MGSSFSFFFFLEFAKNTTTIMKGTVSSILEH